MSAQVIAFPRKKPLEWNELPGYWEIVAKIYYGDAIENGQSPEDAFLEWDLIARAPNVIAGLRSNVESRESYIARLQSIALSPEQAQDRMMSKRNR